MNKMNTMINNPAENIATLGLTAIRSAIRRAATTVEIRAWTPDSRVPKVI